MNLPYLIQERIAARMISEDRLNAYIDQIDGVLYFQVCGCSCIRTCVRVLMYAHAHTHMRVDLRACIHACVCECTHIRTHTHTHTPVCPRAYRTTWTYFGHGMNESPVFASRYDWVCRVCTTWFLCGRVSVWSDPWQVSKCMLPLSSLVSHSAFTQIPLFMSPPPPSPVCMRAGQ